MQKQKGTAMVPRQQKHKGERTMSMKYWYYTGSDNAGSSYTDFTSNNNGSAGSYTDFSGFGNSYADRNSESFRNGYNDYSGFGSGYTDFTQPAQSAPASGYTGYSAGTYAASTGYAASGYAANAGYAAAGTGAPVINRTVRQAPTFVKAGVDGSKKKKGAGKLVIGAFAAIAVMLGAALGAKYFMSNGDNFISKIFSDLGSKATAVPSEIPLGQEGFAKYTTPTKPDKSSKAQKGAANSAANGAGAAGAADGEHRDVYDIADKILSQIKCDNDIDTARAIFTWVHSHVYYQTVGHSQTYEEAALMGFTKKTGDCYVYFSCSKMLLDRAEIPNLMVKRYPVKKSAHFWNLVQLDGQWYHCDATVYKDHPSMYFMLTDEEIDDKYHQFDKSLYPERASNSSSYPDDVVYQPGEYGGDVDFENYGDIDYNPFNGPAEGPARDQDVDYEDFYSDDF